MYRAAGEAETALIMSPTEEFNKIINRLEDQLSDLENKLKEKKILSGRGPNQDHADLIDNESIRQA
jgi:hypothetical protein